MQKIDCFKVRVLVANPDELNNEDFYLRTEIFTFDTYRDMKEFINYCHLNRQYKICHQDYDQVTFTDVKSAIDTLKKAEKEEKYFSYKKMYEKY